MGPWLPSPCSLELKRPLAPQGFVVGHAAEAVAQGVEAVGRVADAEGLDAFGREAAAGQVFARHGAFGPRNCSSNQAVAVSCSSRSLRAQARSGGLFGRGKLALGQRNAALLRRRSAPPQES